MHAPREPRAHVAVLDPAVRVPELDCFNRLALAAPGPLSYHLPALHGLGSLERGDAGLCGVVVLGSGASVHEALPWQDALRAWLAPRVRAGLPTLGLCYGHQLLAQLLGGSVAFAHEDRRKRAGLRRVALDGDPLWGPARELSLLVSHREVVTALGAGCVVRGRSSEVRVEAFAHEALPVWGLQAHPEATLAFARNNAAPLDASEAPALAAGNALVDAFVAFAFERARAAADASDTAATARAKSA